MLSFPSRTACCSAFGRRQQSQPVIAREGGCEYISDLIPARAQLRSSLDERALARVSKDGRESECCLHPSRRLLRKLLRMRSVSFASSKAGDPRRQRLGEKPPLLPACPPIVHPSSFSPVRSVRGSEATPPGLSRENSRPLASGARTALRVRQPNPEPVRRQFPPGPMPVSRRQCFA
jgi:hypothetical protein